MDGNTITVDLTREWLGQVTVEDCVCLLSQIANGEYKPETLRSDIFAST